MRIVSIGKTGVSKTLVLGSSPGLHATLVYASRNPNDRLRNAMGSCSTLQERSQVNNKDRGLKIASFNFGELVLMVARLAENQQGADRNRDSPPPLFVCVHGSVRCCRWLRPKTP